MINKNIKLTLFTNNIRGISSLKYLLKKKLKINYIVISKQNLNNKVTDFLKKKKLKYILINDLKDKKYLQILMKTDLGLVCGFPHIFKSSQIKIPKHGLINLHAGRLPKYRGGSPLNWQIINNEKYFGISVIKINEGVDTGHIIFEKKFKLLNKYKIEDLHKIANKFFPFLLYNSIIKLTSGQKLKKQNESNANYFKQRKHSDSFIEPKLITYKKLNLLLRALSKSYPNPYFFYNDKKIIINKIKKTNIKLNFANSDFIMKSRKIYLKIKDKKIQIVKYKILNV